MSAQDNNKRGLIFAADLGGTHLRAATVDRKLVTAVEVDHGSLLGSLER